MQPNANNIEIRLCSFQDPVKKEVLPKFFKTGKGEYGEGDLFIGVIVPNIRCVAKEYKTAGIETIRELLHSPWHECRLCALLILIEKFKKSATPERKSIVDFYLSQTEHINNWDLVDLSTPHIIGNYLLKDETSRDILYTLAKSSLLWDQRIAMVATLTLIRNNEYAPTFLLAEHFIHVRHDLMRKATGWMLREVGKRDKGLLVEFLNLHHKIMPRTMLRYAIEKLEHNERIKYLSR